MRTIPKIIRFLIVIVSIITGCGIIAGIVDVIKNRNSKYKPKGIYELFFKRVFDFILSAAALIILSPLYLIIGILVRIKMGSPVIFTQERPGKDGKIFRLYKYRTMSDARDENGDLLPDSERMTPLGNWLRRSSLDETLECLNILKGEMSIVGPRPLLKEYLPYYSEEESHRHDVRPGLTGLSQVNGRNYTPWEKRFEYDLSYVNNISFRGDIDILFNTLKAVLTHSGVADRAKIQTNEAGDTFIIDAHGIKHKYPKPLNVERKNV